jgi:hypothetical protein
MKGAPLRIERHADQTALSDTDTPAAKYVEEIAKLIPGEVVAAYLAGKSIIVANSPASGPSNAKWWIGWTVFCFAMVLIIRAFTTSDKEAGVPPEWSAVAVAAISFLLWVYSFGDVFQQLDLWSPIGAGLFLIAWTLASPWILKLLKLVIR